MSTGKLALLLVSGGLAGAAFASLTTGSLPRFVAPEPSRPVVAEGGEAHRSWLDQGLSILDSPAWPFGRGTHDGPPDPPLPPPPEGYAPYGYGAADDYDEHPSYQTQDYAQPAPEQHFAPQPDAASDDADRAAARAADAAQDVIAAENTP